MVEHEVVGPDLVRLGWRLRARARRRNPLPRPLARHLQARRTPQPVCPARAHRVPVTAKKDADATVAVAAPTAPSSARSPAHPWPASGLGSSTPIAPQRTACRPAAPRAHAPGHTPLAAGEPARSPVFCGIFLHHLDLEITLGHQLLQPRVLRLELPQAPDIGRLQAAETLAPSVDRLLADPVPLGHRRNLIAIRLADDRDHLLFRESTFAHCPLRIGSQSLM